MTLCLLTFGTTTAELLALRDWLAGYGVTHVAMESPGVCWKPIFYLLEDAFTCVLANAAQIAPGLGLSRPTCWPIRS